MEELRPTNGKYALPFRQVATIASTALLFFLVGRLGFWMGRSEALLVFPPAGLAVGIPLVLGYRAWPGVFLGSWALGITTVRDPLIVTIVAAGGTLEGLAATWLVKRHAGGSRFFEKPLDILRFVLLAGMLSPLLCPPFGLSGISLSSLAFWAHDSSTLQVWWLGEMTSVLVLTPLLAVWATNDGMRWTVARVAEFTGMLVFLAGVSAAVFTDLPPSGMQSYLLPYLCLPFPLWAALRFGPRATVIATTAQALVAVWGTLRGYGLFAWSVPEKALVAYQVFTAFNSVMGLIVAAIVQQWRQARAALKQANDCLEQKVQQRTQDLSREIEVRKRVEADLCKAHDFLDQRVKERTAELTTANQSLERENRQRRSAEEALSRVLERLIDAQETERHRISRELHDEMGQNLTALKLGLQRAANGSPEPDDHKAILSQLDQLAERLMRNVHRMAWELRPPALDDLGLAPALQRYTREWSERSGISVDFREFASKPRRLPAKVETALYRVAQEALTNVVKHSQATQVSVLLDHHTDFISLIVEDDGKGFDADKTLERPNPEGKMGLLGIQERVASAGGTLQVETATGTGTALYVRIPVERKPLNHKHA